MPTVVGGGDSTADSRHLFSNGDANGPSPMKEDISDVIDAIDPRDTPMLAVLGFGQEAGPAAGADSLRFPCIQPQHSWLNDSLIPSVSAVVSSSGGPPVTGVTVTAGEGEYFNVNDIILIEEGHYRISSISNDTLTVAAVDSETPAAPATGATIYVLGNAQVEGQLAANLVESSTVTEQTTNFTQIFMDVVRVAGSWEATEQYGISNPFDRETDKKIKEVVLKLERAAHYGRRTATFPTSNAQPARRMGGLWHFIRDDANAITSDANGASFNESRLLDLLEEIWAAGGRPDKIYVGSKQKRAMNNFTVPFVNMNRTDSTAGVIVGRYESDFGDIDIVLDRYVKPTDAIVCTTEYLGLGPLKGNGNSRAFSLEKLPRRGDLEEAMILGEYTMEVRNNTRAHGWIFDLAAS